MRGASASGPPGIVAIPTRRTIGRVRMIRRGREARFAAMTGGLVAVLLLSGCVSDAAPDDSETPVLPLTAPTDRPAASASMRTYLDGDQYLRGVNLYTLQQQRALSVDKVVADTQASWDYLASRGFKIVRLAVPWEGLQPVGEKEDPRAGLARPVSEEYLDLVAQQVAYARAAGMRVVLDLHNGCTYPWGTGEERADTLYCGHGLETEDVLRVWEALSGRFAQESAVAAYNLFNEPRRRTGAETYFAYVNAVVADLRSRGDDKVVWVDSILTSSFATDAMGSAPITDPADAVIYAQHFYLHGGTRDSLLSRIRDFGEWCDNRAVRCAIGEIGWPETVGDDKTDTFDLAYDLADHYEMDVTYFAATSVAGPKSLIAYYASEGGSTIDSRRGQSEIIENHPSR